MPSVTRSDTTSLRQGLAFGVIGTVLGILAVLIAILQYQSVRQMNRARTRTFELDAVESQVRLTVLINTEVMAEC
jgi:ABC-type lipoprotein release transport system permease subunit